MQGDPDFDRIVALYCHLSGEPWTDELESQLTFGRLLARHAFWRDNPPPAALLPAIALGLGVWKPKRQHSPDAVATLLGLFPTGRI